LTRAIGISPQALHRHLKKLVELNILKRNGSPPHVFYQMAMPQSSKIIFKNLDKDPEQVINQRFSSITPTGQYIEGLPAFQQWVTSIAQEKAYGSLALAYTKLITQIYNPYEKVPYLDATTKIQSTFKKCEVEKMFYADFYALPQFGKTRLGHQLTIGKSGQNRAMIRRVAEASKAIIVRILKDCKIQAIAFAPHSIPRKVVFLTEFRRYLKLDLPQIKIVKSFSGGFPIAQKSLSKLQDRITNARETIFIPENAHHGQRVLLIDDAVGSGATINETATKLKHQGIAKQVFGFAITGSYKGFEVIAEV